MFKLKFLSVACSTSLILVLSASQTFASPSSYYDNEETNAQIQDSSAIVTKTETDTTIRNLSNNISTSVRSVISNKIEITKADGKTGVNAGDENTKLLGYFENVWSSADANFVNTNPWNQKSIGTDTDSYTASFGTDTSIGDNLIVGAALAFNHSSTEIGTTTNGQEIEQQANGFTLAPYLAYILNDNYYISSVVGYSFSSISNDTLNSSGNESSNSKFDTKTYFLSLEGNYLDTINDVDILGSVGMTVASSYFPTYTSAVGTTTDARSDTSRSLYIAGQASFPKFASYQDLGLIPTTRVAYEYDHGLEGIGNSAARFTAGVSRNMYDDSVNLSLEGNFLKKRHQASRGMMLNVNVAF